MVKKSDLVGIENLKSCSICGTVYDKRYVHNECPKCNQR